MAAVPNQPPATLKPVSHYLKVGAEHDTRDPVIAYWARFAAVQKSLTIDKSSPEAKMFVIGLLEWLEAKKKALAGNEAITIEAAGEAHIENYALKLFHWADQADRSATFNKNVVKAFYTSGVLFDILESLSNILQPEFISARKYAKWRAAYIHNCLRNGETPVPGGGAIDDDDEENEGFGGGGGGGDEEGGVDEKRTSDDISGGGGGGGVSNFGWTTSGGGGTIPNNSDQSNSNFGVGAGGAYGGGAYGFPPGGGGGQQYPPPPTNSDHTVPYQPPSYVPPPPAAAPQSHPHHQQVVAPPPPSVSSVTGNGGGGAAVNISVEQIAKAQKYCKWAGSALNFEDVTSAIDSLEKALHLLKTGQELA